MKNLLVVVGLMLAASASARAQAVDPNQLARDIAGLKAQVAKAKAALPAAAEVDKSRLDELVGRLDRDGEDGDGETKVFTHAGAPAADGSFRNTRMTLYERTLPSPTFTDPKTGLTFTQTVMRKALLRVQGELKTYQRMPGGEAKIESWTFVVTLDGKLVEVTKGLYVGKRHGDDGVDVDPKRSKELRMKPTEPDVLKRWKGLCDEFLKYGNAVQA